MSTNMSLLQMFNAWVFVFRKYIFFEIITVFWIALYIIIDPKNFKEKCIFLLRPWRSQGSQPKHVQTILSILKSNLKTFFTWNFSLLLAPCNSCHLSMTDWKMLHPQRLHQHKLSLLSTSMDRYQTVYHWQTLLSMLSYQSYILGHVLFRDNQPTCNGYST